MMKISTGTAVAVLGLGLSLAAQAAADPSERLGGIDAPVSAVGDIPAPDLHIPLGPRTIVAGIIGMEKKGARVVEIELNVGGRQNIRPGLQGTVLNGCGLAEAGVRVRKVYPDRCLAEVIALSGDLSEAARVMIDDVI